MVENIRYCWEDTLTKVYLHFYIYMMEMQVPTPIPLTVHHLLVSCPLYATARFTAFGYYFSIQEPLSLVGLLGDAGRPPLLAVLSFLKACHLFMEF